MTEEAEQPQVAVEAPKKRRWTKFADERLRVMFLNEARAKCTDKIQDYVNCARDNGLMVVFKCRQHNKDMNACVAEYTTEDLWETYRQQKIDQYLAEGAIVAPPRK